MRIQEAKCLLDNGFYEGAYYLAGYAVECGLKACIAKQIKQYEFPDKKFVGDSYTHDLNKLLGLSGLREEHRTRAEDEPSFANNWTVVKDWSEEERYTVQVDEPRARDLLAAITDNDTGILSWSKKWW